jgi:imidazolonepropionase-like amidohydrolase
MDHDEALKAITINPARICGIDSRVGSIARGKDADLTFFRTDPLSLNAKPEVVVAGGVIMKKSE